MSVIPITILRLSLRLANAFLLEVLAATRGEKDFTDALILAALVQSNSAQITGDHSLQQRYGDFASPPPASIRRPISMSGLAASLGLPFETVRRRIKRLAAAGVCEITPEGARYAETVLRSPELESAMGAIYAAARSFYFRLRRAGCLDFFASQPGPVWSGKAPPLRIVYRASNDYFLRMMEHLLPRVANLSQAFILLTVMRINTAGFPDTMHGGEGAEAEAFPPDAYRKPARAGEVAAALGLPNETVRRNLLALVEEGRCERTAAGYIVPAAVLARANVLVAWDANLRDLTRMFSDLNENGVLGLWEAEITQAHASGGRV